MVKKKKINPKIINDNLFLIINFKYSLNLTITKGIVNMKMVLKKNGKLKKKFIVYYQKKPSQIVNND